MAVTGLVFMSRPGQEDALAAALLSFPGIVERRRAKEGRIVAVLECSSRDIRDRLEAAASLPAVLELSVAYADYEDDLDAGGHMRCPQHRKNDGAGT